MRRRVSIGYSIFFVVLIGGLFAYLYRLKLLYGMVLIVCGGVILPFVIYEKRTAVRKEADFIEMNRYIEQILYSFRKSPQILSALIDVEKIFEAGRMSSCIREAIAYIRETYEGEQITKEALKIIEKAYPCRQIKNVHRLMLKVERLGGDYENSVMILLKDRDVWEKETRSHQKRCSMQKRNTVIAIFLSFGLCLMTPVLCRTSLKEIAILDSSLYQIGTLLMLMTGMFIYYLSERFFARNLWMEKEEEKVEVILKKYRKVRCYHAAKARITSWMLGGVTAFVAVYFAMKDRWLICGLFVPLTLFMLFQHRLDYALAKKAVVHEVRKVFPNWLMEVALLLQTENVQNSIKKSLEHASGILKPELELLIENLERSPESNLPYCAFLKEFSIPEVISAMGMLYSISDGSGANANVQIEEILERNARWKAEAKALENQDKEGQLYGLFLLPALSGAVKLVLDMTLILLAFFAGAVV